MEAIRRSIGGPLKVQWSAASDVGRVRHRNEDAHAVFSLPQPVGGTLFVVADGVGGQQAGDVASSLALERLRSILPAWAAGRSAVPVPGDVGRALARSLQQVNDALFKAASERPEWRGMATTLTVVRVNESSYQFAHVGDSRLYLFRGGRLTQLSKDHALVSELIRTGEITRDQARRHPSRHVLTQAVGINQKLKVDTGFGMLGAGDALLLCTDGLLAVLDEKEMALLLSRSPSSRLAHRMVEIANERGSPDNVTVIAIAYDAFDGGIDDGHEVENR